MTAGNVVWRQHGVGWTENEGSRWGGECIPISHSRHAAGLRLFNSLCLTWVVFLIWWTTFTRLIYSIRPPTLQSECCWIVCNQIWICILIYPNPPANPTFENILWVQDGGGKENGSQIFNYANVSGLVHLLRILGRTFRPCAFQPVL